jgi:hypothetical protein
VSLCQGFALSHACRAIGFVGVAVDEITLVVEVVMKGSVRGGEFLQHAYQREPMHRAPTTPEWLRRIFSPIVVPVAIALLVIGIADPLHG